MRCWCYYLCHRCPSVPGNDGDGLWWTEETAWWTCRKVKTTTKRWVRVAGGMFEFQCFLKEERVIRYSRLPRKKYITKKIFRSDLFEFVQVRTGSSIVIIFGARAAAAEKEKENMNPAWLKVLSPSWRLSLLGQLYYLLEGTPCLTWIEDDVQEEKLLLVGCMVPYCDVYIHIIHLVNWYEFFKLLNWFLLDNYNTVSTGVCARTTRNQNQYNATTRLELTRPNPLLIFIIV